MRNKKTAHAAGVVYLVGAGPWAADLITVRGLKILKRADCIVYDRLVNDRLLQYAPPAAELIYAGKKSGNHSKSQSEINELLADRASSGGVVVRLKGGDPYIFGRGGEEAQYLGGLGINYEVIPGISSFYAAATYAGIPLTHRACAASFAVLTGHRRKDADTEIDIPLVDTLVVMMGVGNIEKIVEKVLQKGYNPQTPAAAVQWGTSPRQKVVTADLSALPEKIAASQISPPAVIIIGEVVNCRKDFSFYEKRSLFGKKVVVTRPPDRMADITEQLEEMGCEVIQFPTIQIKPLQTREIIEAAEKLSDYDYLIFTSPAGVQIFLDSIFEKHDARWLAGLQILTIGPGTAQFLGRYGLKSDFIPDEYRAEGLLDFFQDELGGEKILIPRASQAREILPDQLARRGAEVNILPVYETVKPELKIPAEIIAGDFDMITFTSSSTVNNFFDIVGEDKACELLGATETVCIGPITASSLADKGIDSSAVAKKYTIEGVLEASRYLWTGENS